MLKQQTSHPPSALPRVLRDETLPVVVDIGFALDRALTAHRIDHMSVIEAC